MNLTSRQQEVVELIAQGLGRKEVAAELKVSPKTVEYHVAKAKESLDLDRVNDVKLCRQCYRLGLITL